MKKILTITAYLSLLALSSCNSGGGSGGGSGGSGGVSNAPSNAFTQALAQQNTNNFFSFSYNASSSASSACQNVIEAGSNIYYNNGSFGYNYIINGASAQLCDSNKANCINSNNTNTPCINGTQTLNGVSQQVVWTNCSFAQNVFTAQLTISNGTQSCSGNVSGQFLAIPSLQNVVRHDATHVLILNTKPQ